MNKFFKEISGNKFLLFMILILVFPSLLINLGLTPFILDEATRANVALEMIFSGDYLHPTINGEWYFNKPPLYNWILVAATKVGGDFSEFIFRLPTVLSLLFFSLSIYLTQRKIFGRSAAFLASLAFLSCGRILFYDSLRGLIDISFSWVIYMLFWTVYHFGEKEKYFRLFIYSYLLASIGFLMKGMPALVFLFISLAAGFFYRRKFKMLFRIPHLAGILVFLTIAGSYLLAFSRGMEINDYFKTLWSESSSRTFIDNSLWDSIKHLFLFPFEFLYHFAPWTILVLLFVVKANRKILLSHPASRLFTVIFFANIAVYWISPAIYPRYLFMFLPLLFGMSFFVFMKQSGNEVMNRILLGFFAICTLALSILLLLIPYLSDRDLYSHFWLKYIIILVLLIMVLIPLKKGFKNLILVLAAVILVSRIAFNLFVIPDRIANESYQYQKNGAVLAGKLTAGKALYIAKGTSIHHASSFYIMREREEILGYLDRLDADAFYIIEKEKGEEYPPYDVLCEFETRIEARKLSVVRFRK